MNHFQESFLEVRYSGIILELRFSRVKRCFGDMHWFDVLSPATFNFFNYRPTVVSHDKQTRPAYVGNLEAFERFVKRSTRNVKTGAFFPERLGEGRFLGAVSLSSLTWLAWFKLLNLNLLDLTCLTWTCLTKTFLTWLSWLDLGKLLTWSA